MQRHRGVDGESLEPFLHQFGVERTHLVAHEFSAEDEKRPAGNVDRHARERLVHGNVDIGVARNAFHIAERLLHRLAERDPDILGGVMMIDMQVALSLDLDVDARVTRQQIEHVIEKTYARGDGRTAFAVKVDRNLDGGFLGGTFHRRLAHGLLRGAQRLLSGL